jgi:hypothetical protein
MRPTNNARVARFVPTEQARAKSTAIRDRKPKKGYSDDDFVPFAATEIKKTPSDEEDDYGRSYSGGSYSGDDDDDDHYDGAYYRAVWLRANQCQQPLQQTRHAEAPVPSTTLAPGVPSLAALCAAAIFPFGHAWRKTKLAEASVLAVSGLRAPMVPPAATWHEPRGVSESH